MHCSHVAAQNVVSENRVEEKKKNALRNTFASCQSLSLDVWFVCVFIRCEGELLEAKKFQEIHGYLNWLVMKYQAGVF